MIGEHLLDCSISKLPAVSLWSVNNTAVCDMCVADPSGEQTSSSMATCTRDTNDDVVAVDLDPPPIGQDDTCSDIQIAEVFSVDEESPVKNSKAKDENFVMISDDETETKAEKPSKNKGVNGGIRKKDVQPVGVSASTSASSTVSADLISEIDKEILKSLQGKFMSLKNILGEIKSGGAKTKRDGTSRPGRESWIEHPKPAVKQRPTIQSRQYKKEDNVKSKKSDVDESTNTIRLNWEMENINKVKVEDKKDIIPAKSFDVDKKAVKTVDSSEDNQSKDDKNEDDVVWICFICAKEFPNQEELMSHQNFCDEDLPDSDNLISADSKPSSVTSTDSRLNTATVSSPVVESEVVFMGNNPTPNVGLPKPAVSRPVPAHLTKVGTGIKTLPLGLPRRIPKRRIVKEIYIPPPRDKYFECLGLGETPTVEEIFKSPRKSVSEDDCQFIDLTVDESKSQLTSPMTPRTRSLMSQLSRDESVRKRQLSFSASPCKPETKTEIKVCENKMKPAESSDSESSESSEEETSKCKTIPCRSALLGIPLSSPLGQRLKKHWQNEFKVPVISNIEMFCKASEDMSEIDHEVVDKKNPVMEKLRNRPPPQVTFKFTKKYLNKWFHRYKFNKADKREFEKTVKTGLGRESRIRAKQMKPFKLVLHRLKEKEIKHWTTSRREKRVIHRFSQVGLKNRVLQMRPFIRHPQPSRPQMILLNHQNRNRYMSPIFTQQPFRFSQRNPTPRLLVTNVRNSYMPMRSLLTGQQPQSGPSLVDRRSQKRKQTFDQLRTDDNLVICLSSDDEEEVDKKPGSCNKCSISNGPCLKHRPRVWPGCEIIDMQAKKPSLNTQQSGLKTPGGHQTDCASSRVFGKSVTNTQTPPVKQANSGFFNCRIVNGQMIDGHKPVNGQVLGQKSAQTSTSQGSHKPMTGQIGSQKEVNKTEETITGTNSPSGPDIKSVVAEPSESGRSQSDSEYMDYEVICIDSDYDDE